MWGSVRHHRGPVLSAITILTQNQTAVPRVLFSKATHRGLQQGMARCDVGAGMMDSGPVLSGAKPLSRLHGVVRGGLS